MTTDKKPDWQQLGKDFGMSVLKGIGLGCGFAIAGAGAGFVASKLSKNDTMTTGEAGARGGNARRAA